MTREEAIHRIKDHMVHHGIGRFPHILLAEAMKMAIAALREQEERSKGCPYCLYLEPLCIPDGEIIAIETDGKQYVIEGDYWGFGIKFCPKCGRKLEVEG